MNDYIEDNNQNGGTLTTTPSWRLNGYDSDDTMVDSEYDIPVMGHQNVISGTPNSTNGNSTSLISRINTIQSIYTTSNTSNSIAFPSNSINSQPTQNQNNGRTNNRKSTGKKSNPNSDIIKKRNCISHANFNLLNGQ